MKNLARLVCAVLLAAIPLLAQNAPAAPPQAPPVNRLPSDTWVLFTWHGLGSVSKVRATNPILRIWDDPAFQSSRTRIAEKLLDEVAKEQAAKGSKSSGFTKEDFEAALSLAENPLIFGVAGNPFPPGGAGKTSKSVGFFGIYDKTGKAAILTRLEQRFNENRTTGKKVEKSQYTFRGVEVTKTVTTTLPEQTEAKSVDPSDAEQAEGQEAETKPEPKIETSYTAAVGNYELYSDKQAVIESLITRTLDGGSATDSLATQKVFQDAQRFRAEGTLLEMFLNIPDLSRLPIPPNEKFDAGAMLRELHLERLKGISLSAGLTTDRMLMRMAVFGDTLPGSLFDLMGGGNATFETLAAAPASGTYGAFRMDLGALYGTLLRAVKAGLPPEQAAMADMLDGLVAMQTGMSLTHLLGLFRGEIGTVTTGEAQLAEVLPDIVMLPVTDGQPVLGLLRTLLGKRISGEEQLGGATVLTMSPPAAAQDGDKPEAVQPFYVAVAPKLLIVATSKEQLSGVLARAASGTPAPAGSMAAHPGFQSARKAMPANLSGISYADYSTYPWEKAQQQMQKQFAKQKQELLDKADAAMKGDGENPPDAKKAEEHRKSAQQIDLIREVADALIPLMKRYLHTSAGAVWKAADGIFMESYTK